MPEHEPENVIEQDVDAALGAFFGDEPAPATEPETEPAEDAEDGAEAEEAEHSDAKPEPAQSKVDGDDRDLERIRTAARYAGMTPSMIEKADPDDLRAWFKSHERSERDAREAREELARLRREAKPAQAASSNGAQPSEPTGPTETAPPELDLEPYVRSLAEELGEDGAKAHVEMTRKMIADAVQHAVAPKVSEAMQQTQQQQADVATAERAFNSMRADGRLGELPADAFAKVVNMARTLGQGEGPWSTASSREEAVQAVTEAAARALYGKLGHEVKAAAEATARDEARKQGQLTTPARASRPAPKNPDDMSTEALIGAMVDDVVMKGADEKSLADKYWR